MSSLLVGQQSPNALKMIFVAILQELVLARLVGRSARRPGQHAFDVVRPERYTTVWYFRIRNGGIADRMEQVLVIGPYNVLLSVECERGRLSLLTRPYHIRQGLLVPPVSFTPRDIFVQRVSLVVATVLGDHSRVGGGVVQCEWVDAEVRFKRTRTTTLLAFDQVALPDDVAPKPAIQVDEDAMQGRLVTIEAADYIADVTLVELIIRALMNRSQLAVLKKSSQTVVQRCVHFSHLKTTLVERKVERDALHTPECVVQLAAVLSCELGGNRDLLPARQDSTD